MGWQSQFCSVWGSRSLGPKDSVSMLQALVFIVNFTGFRIYRRTLLNGSVMPFTERTEEERPILNAQRQHHSRGWVLDWIRMRKQTRRSSLISHLPDDGCHGNSYLTLLYHGVPAIMDCILNWELFPLSSIVKVLSKQWETSLILTSVSVKRIKEIRLLELEINVVKI